MSLRPLLCLFLSGHFTQDLLYLNLCMLGNCSCIWLSSVDFFHTKKIFQEHHQSEQGPVAQSVVSPIADPGVMSLIQAWPHTFVEIDREIFSMGGPS